MAERIKERRKQNGLTQEELAARMGFSIQTIRRWEWGQRSPRADELEKLANALGTSVSYLMGVDDTPASPHPATPPMPESNIRPIRGPFVQVPVLGAQSSICCGKGFNLQDVDAEVEWYEPVPESWLTGPRGEWPYYITHVEGNSMEPMIEDGERILVNPNQEIAHGDIAVVCWNDRSMVRGVKFDRGGSVHLIPANKAYQEDLISKEDAPYVLRFNGVVLRFLGKDRLSRGIL